MKAYDHYYVVLGEKFLRINGDYGFCDVKRSLAGWETLTIRKKDIIVSAPVAGHIEQQKCVVPQTMTLSERRALANPVSKLCHRWSTIALRYYS